MPELEAAGGNAQPPLPGVLPRGTMLRSYEVTSVLGKGAFGITYRAVDSTLHRDVAIKEYLPTTLALREGRTTVLPHSPDHAEQFAWGRERFLDEARTLARLDRTPAIVRVFDFLEANGTAYMVMALIEGETLSKLLMREQQLTPEAVQRILYPLLDGLEQLHAATFLHRDIKPANLMVDEKGKPTLIDFGASRAAMAERSTTMTAIFTPGYAAAEQFVPNSKLGPWTDIYGLSATLYHSITGRIPPSAIQRILQDDYEPLGKLNPEGYPASLLEAIDAGLAIRATDRPQSIVEWRHMLGPQHSAESQAATHMVRRPGPLARAARRGGSARLTLKGPALWGAMAAGILLLMGGGYYAWVANVPGSAATAALTLSADQLEQALAERRKADALANEKRRLEEEARQKAEADAAIKRQADEELEKAQQARMKAEQELAQLKADIEARRQASAGQSAQAAAAQRAVEEEAQRKAEAEAAALREAEEDAARKAEADAEAKRQADQALAVAEAQRKQAEADARAKAETEATARSQASENAQRKAEVDAGARRQADEAQAKAQAEREKVEAEAKIKADAATVAKLKEEVEAAERALRLELPDRQRIQVALTSLGFDTRGSDGVLGPRSREMIAGWQKKAGASATGFVTAAQRDQLFRSAAPAIARWEEEQKKIEDERKKADTATTMTAPTHQGPVATIPAPVASTAVIRTRALFVLTESKSRACENVGIDRDIAVAIHPGRIEVQMRWGWETFKVNDDGSFSGSVVGPATFAFANTYSAAKFMVRGNVRSKEMRVEMPEPSGSVNCAWKGTIS